MKLRFRAFRAIDEYDTCCRFIEGHVKVLIDYGITNITTNNNAWVHNPSIYCITAESEPDGEIVGGIRIQIADGMHRLPVEDAIGKMDPKVYDLIAAHSEEGTGELCGLWNSKGVAGMGVSLLLVRAGISIVNQLNLTSLFTICAEYTLPMVKRVGFIVEDSLGKEGEFVYPNENYIARVLRKMNAITLETADAFDKRRILELRRNPVQKEVAEGPKGILEVDYYLQIDNLQT